MGRIRQYDVVRIDSVHKDLSGSHCFQPVSQPVVGEEATVVEVLAKDVFILESVNDAGETLWLIEVSARDVDLTVTWDSKTERSVG